MQTVKNFFAGLDKTTVKQFITVTGIILFFVLVLTTAVLAVTTDWDTTGWFVATLVTAVITGIAGKEIFMETA
jgi:hypothetical protein